MKKVFILCPSGTESKTLADLQDLGVIHVEPFQPPSGSELEQARAECGILRKAIEALPSKGDGSGLDHPPGELAQALQQTLSLRSERQEQLQALETEKNLLLPFGDFDTDSVEALREEGIQLFLYRMPIKEALPTPGEFVRIDCGRDKQFNYFALVGQGIPHLEREPLPFPKRSLSQLEQLIKDTHWDLEVCETELGSYAQHADVLNKYLAEREDALMTLEVQAGMGLQGPVAYLKGFCPEKEIAQLTATAKEQGWGISVEPTSDKDVVPTLIQNPAWVRIIDPVLNFIGIFPGYREVDISACFLLFFTLFFGMIVGDAGYGFIFLVAALIGRFRFPKARLITSMLLLMSLMTIAWGVLTANYFGIAIGSLPQPLAQLRLSILASENQLMFFCFLIGAIHLTIAHLWRALIWRNRWVAVAQLGWVAMTWVMFFAARTMILGAPFPRVMMIPLIAGGVAITLFMTPLGKMKEEWFNHIVLPLNIVNNFVDVVSYVRLFAVGMATLAVASAFNEMALGIGFGTVLSGLGAGLIIFFGHTLNIALALMGVLVHGIRLNALEFSGHLGLEWSGSHISPLLNEQRKVKPKTKGVKT